MTKRSSGIYKYVYMQPMASKNITITEDAYDRLKALKREDESFSDLVTRLTEQTDPMAFAGSCPGLGARVDEARGELADDLDDTHDELFR
ncbi:antitoxin VapB family protein [Salinigranum marinum]|uniref:antitoxin VapB family protein n=1 Tax=Salinigranum marinum TaxID=1515595 RepID=UPI002989E46A|nr:antitoxin VapB family protein [Salinigranum marinum]